MSERMSYAGTHRARAKEWALDVQGGKECIVVRFEFVGGQHEGRSIQWWGYFTEKTEDRTIESMRHCGWDSDSLAELDSLGNNEVDLVIEDEEYQGKWRSKVKWVNRLQRLNVKAPMNQAQLSAFAARMRGKTVASKQKYGAQPAPSAARPVAAASGSDNWDGDPGPADDDIPW